MTEERASGTMFNQEQKENFIEYYKSTNDYIDSAKTTKLFKDKALDIIFLKACAPVEKKYQTDVSMFKFQAQYYEVVSNFPPVERQIWENFNLLRQYITWCFNNHFVREQDMRMNPFMKDMDWMDVANSLNIKKYLFVKNAEHLVKLLEHSLLPIQLETFDTRLRCIYYAFYMGFSEKILMKTMMKDIDLGKETFLDVNIPDCFLPAFRVYCSMSGENTRASRGEGVLRLYKDPKYFVRTTSTKTASAENREKSFITRIISANNPRLSDPDMPGASFALKEINLTRNEKFYTIAKYVESILSNHPNLSEMFMNKNQLVATSLSKGRKNNFHTYIEFLFYLRMYFPNVLDTLNTQKRLDDN